jgi:hypothetical protein
VLAAGTLFMRGAFVKDMKSVTVQRLTFNPLNRELNPICHQLALLGARHILHVSGIRVKLSDSCLYLHVFIDYLLDDGNKIWLKHVVVNIPTYNTLVGQVAQSV